MSLRSWNLVVQTCVIVTSVGCSDAKVENPAGAGAGGTAGTNLGGKGGSGAGGSNAAGSAGTASGSGGTVGGATASGGSSGATVNGGTAGLAGTSGADSNGGMAGGTAGVSGAAGSATAGSGGGQTASNCKFQISGATSKAIATVGVVDWSADLAGLTEARVEFTLDDARPDELNKGSGGNVDISGTTHRALLLGLKAQRSYTYRIVASAGSTVCTSEDQTLTTGALANGVPTIAQDIENAAAIDSGFIVTCTGSVGGGGGGGTQQFGYIFDADGDVVWAAAAPASCSRALMNYEGTDLWMLELNVDNGGGEMRRVSMDGMDVEMNVAGLERVHHDFTVLPGGIVAGPSWVSSGRDPPSDLIERSPDGSIDTVVTIDESVYQANTYHTNAIGYYPESNTYTLGDRNPNAFVHISRTGQVLWQFGGSCDNAPAAKCATGNWQVNHGHHLLPNGNFVFFNNGMTGGSTAYEYSLTEGATSLTASVVWSYSAQGVNSMVLGDTQRTPNGNTIVIYSNAGEIHEVDPQENLVQTFSTDSFGYANFRKTLYGAPLR